MHLPMLKILIIINIYFYGGVLKRIQPNLEIILINHHDFYLKNKLVRF
jgi:hypothetical protein